MTAKKTRAAYNNNNYFIWWIRCFEKKTKNLWSYLRKTSETISDSAECNWWLLHGSPILSKNSPLLSLLTVCIYLGSLLGLLSPSTMYVYVSFKIQKLLTIKPGSHFCDKHNTSEISISKRKKGTCFFFLVLLYRPNRSLNIPPEHVFSC